MKNAEIIKNKLTTKQKSESKKLHSRYSRNKKSYNTVLIKNASFVFTCDKTEKLVCRKNYSIAIENDTIVGFAPLKKFAQKKFDLVYDAGKRGGTVITPGFINVHTHPPMYTMRSAMMFENETVDETIAAMSSWEQAMNEQDLTLGAIGNFTEEQKHGVATTLSHYAIFEPSENAARLTKHNLINALSAASNSHPEYKPDFEKLIKEKKAYCSRPAIALHYLYKATPEKLKEISELVKKHNFLFTCHMAESPLVEKKCVEVHGQREVATLKKYGLLNKNTLVSHAIYINKKEIKQLIDNQVGIAHLPTSNTIHKSGVFPLWKFFALDGRSRIALGTDSVVSKSRMDILTEAYQARMTHLYKKKLKFGTLFKMMTVNGARVLGIKDRGQILPGMKADLAIWKLKDRGFIPFDKNNPFVLIGNLITHNGRTVRDLMVNGKFVISNRKHEHIDESKLLEELQKSQMAMRKRLRH